MKKLIMFLMVVAISFPALATIEDLDPPQWGSTQPAATLVYQFEEDGDYDGGSAEPSCLSGSDDFTLIAPDGSWADGVLTTTGDTFFAAAIPEGSGENVTIRVQAIITSGSPGEFIVDLRGDGFVFLDESVILNPPVSPLADDLYVYQATLEYNPDAFFAGVSIIGGNNVFEGVIVDVLVHDGDAPDTGDRVSDCLESVKPAITVDSNDLPVYEPYDPPDGPAVEGPTEGQLLVSLTWRPGDPTYPAFTATVVVEPNEVGPHEDFIFIGADPNGNVYLTFDETNWDIPQNVVVKAVADLDREGNESYPVELTVTIDIADPNFGNPTPVVVAGFVGVIDNDVPFISLSTHEIEISESDPCTCVDLKIRLSHKPTDTVFVRLYTEEFAFEEGMVTLDPPLVPGELDPNVLTFRTADGTTWDQVTMTSGWNVEQTVTVCPIDNDELAEAWLEFIPGDIWIPGFSTDVRYRVPWFDAEGNDVDDSGGELAEELVEVLVQDNECGAVGFAGMDFNEDCAVGLADFVSFYAEWTLCTEPYEDDCDMAWNLLVE